MEDTRNDLIKYGRCVLPAWSVNWVVVDGLVGRGLDADTASVDSVCRCSYHLGGVVMVVVCSSYVYMGPCVGPGRVVGRTLDRVVGRTLDGCIVLMDDVCCGSDLANQSWGSFCGFRKRDRLVVID